MERKWEILIRDYGPKRIPHRNRPTARESPKIAGGRSIPHGDHFLADNSGYGVAEFGEARGLRGNWEPFAAIMDQGDSPAASTSFPRFPQHHGQSADTDDGPFSDDDN